MSIFPFDFDGRTHTEIKSDGNKLEVIYKGWKCIYTAVESHKAPVTFFEQGGAHIFDINNLSEKKKQVVQNRINLVPFIYTVSSYTKDKIKEVYNKESDVICNAVDSNIFFPRNPKDIKKDINELLIQASYREKSKMYQNKIAQMHPQGEIMIADYVESVIGK